MLQKRVRERGRTDEESSRESPFLSAADNGERQPVSGDEGMEKRNGGDSSDRG